MLPIEKTLFSSSIKDNNLNNIFHVDYLKHQFTDFARPNLYKIVFNFTRQLSYKSNEKVLTEQCAKSVTIPNFEITKKEIRRMGYKIPVAGVQSFPDINCTFICDENYIARNFLHNWMNNNIYDTSTNMYPQSYSDDSIDIFQLNSKFDITFGIHLNNAWPNSIGETQLTSESDGQVVEFPVTFTYSTYEIYTFKTSPSTTVQPTASNMQKFGGVPKLNFTTPLPLSYPAPTSVSSNLA